MREPRYLDGIPHSLDPPQGFYEGMPIRRCLRSGFCCKQATCFLGVQLGQPTKGCGLLRGNGPGEYRCGAIEDHPEYAEGLAIGEGCCSDLFNTDREKVLGITREGGPPRVSAGAARLVR